MFTVRARSFLKFPTQAPAWDATCTTFNNINDNNVFQEHDQCLGCCVSDLAMLRDAMPSGKAQSRVYRLAQLIPMGRS